MDPVQGAAPREGQQRAAGQLIRSLSSTGGVTPRLEGLEASWRSIHALGAEAAVRRDGERIVERICQQPVRRKMLRVRCDVRDARDPPRG